MKSILGLKITDSVSASEKIEVKNAATVSNSKSASQNRNAKEKNRIFETKKWEIENLLKQEGCPVCWASNDQLERNWFWFFSESYGEGSGVSQYINFYGFCEKHTLEVAKRGPEYVKSAIYHWIISHKLPQLEQALREINENANSGKISIISGLEHRRVNKKLDVLKPSGSCLFCESYEATERRTVETLLVVLQAPEIRDLYGKTEGLCMKHFFKALDFTDSQYSCGLREILTFQVAKLKALEHDFDEYFRKTDYRFSKEPKGNEQTTWMRAIRTFIGDLEPKSKPNENRTSHEG